MLDLTNKKFHRLTAIRPVGQSKQRVYIWECQCDCGKIVRVIGSKIRNGLTKSCGCLKAENIRPRFGSAHHGWDGYEEISKSFYSRMIHSAKLRGWTWNLTIEYLWDLYLVQNKKCALSGRNISMPIFMRDLVNKKCETTASLDRIDPKKGYEMGNVQWICKRINYMKHIMKEESFLAFVKDIYEYKKLQVSINSIA